MIGSKYYVRNVWVAPVDSLAGFDPTQADPHAAITCAHDRHTDYLGTQDSLSAPAKS